MRWPESGGRGEGRRVFYGLLEEDLDAFCPVSGGRHLGCIGFGDVVFHFFLLFRRMMIPKILQSYSLTVVF